MRLAPMLLGGSIGKLLVFGLPLHSQMQQGSDLSDLEPSSQVPPSQVGVNWPTVPPSVGMMPDVDPGYPYIEETEANGGVKEAKSFVGDFEDGTLNRFKSTEGVSNQSIKVVTEPVRHGRYAAKVTVHLGDEIYHGNRAEFTMDLDPPGSQGWYGWSLLVPESYPMDGDASHWQITAQFHDQPDTAAGQTWDVFPPHNSSIALYLLTTNNVTALALGIGINLPKGTWQYGPIAIQKGQWQDIVFHIGWSTGDDGFVEAWVKDQSLTPAGRVEGRTMYYAFADYLKLGLYRDPDIEESATLFFDEIRTGPTRESVAVPSELSARHRRNTRLRSRRP